ncbi:MAG TPA: hypothetical protein PL079_07465 [Tenuifilaceae bacterium]|nr:hypothetical protein [Tenuifilaceae bacterium]
METRKSTLPPCAGCSGHLVEAGTGVGYIHETPGLRSLRIT